MGEGTNNKISPYNTQVDTALEKISMSSFASYRVNHRILPQYTPDNAPLENIPSKCVNTSSE